MEYRKNIFSLTVAFTLFAGCATPAAVRADDPPPHTKAKYGPMAAPLAIPLALRSGYFRDSDHHAKDFWALIGYYVPQQPNTCSAATVATVLNALLSHTKKFAEDKLVTQDELLETITSPGWKKSSVNRAMKLKQKGLMTEKDQADAIKKLQALLPAFITENLAEFHENEITDQLKSKIALTLQANLEKNFKEATITAESEMAGDKNGNCASLGELHEIVKEALAMKGIPATVKKVYLDPSIVKNKDGSDYRAAKKSLIRDLVENERSRNNFMIINFNQQKFTDDADTGHMSTIGAYDADSGRVLVLDPDRDWYEPYWVTVDTLISGMATKDDGSSNPRGYLFIERTQKK